MSADIADVLIDPELAPEAPEADHDLEAEVFSADLVALVGPLWPTLRDHAAAWSSVAQRCPAACR